VRLITACADAMSSDTKSAKMANMGYKKLFFMVLIYDKDTKKR
jgi:hypothetical protein